MEIRGGWAQVVKFVGVTVLVAILLPIAAIRNTGKRNHQPGVRPSPVPANETVRSTRAQANPEWTEAYGRLPLSFEENVGQTAREVRYVSHGSRYELFLTPQEAVLALRPNLPLDLSPPHRAATIRALQRARQAGQMTVMRLRLDGANPEAQILGIDRLPNKVNYFIGNDPKKWHSNVSSYARVKYTSVYPGVDLVFYGNQGRLEYDFVVAPGADPHVIALKLEGARRMSINSRGDLVLSVSGGEVEFQKPVIYQNVKGERREIAGRYALSGDHRVTFAVASYDRTEPLVVDPALTYSTYLGGGGDEFGFAIAVDAAGNAFVAGQTLSTDFPPGAHGAVVTPPTTNSGASFVAELNPTGTQLLYSTYLAGTTTNALDGAFGIAVDSSGKVYVTGSTFATNFPTTPTSLKPGPLLVNPNGTAFVTKLDPTASGNSSLVYSTYLGGTGGEFGNAIAADAAGNAYIAGITHSVDFPTKNAFQSAPKNAFGTAFLTRIDTTQLGGNSLIYSTYLGGTAGNFSPTTGPAYGDQAFGIAVDSAHFAYVVGTTTSKDTSLTTTTAYQTTPPAANVLASAFASKIDTTKTGATSLIYSTYLAGTTQDQGFAMALGPGNVIYATGTADSGDYPFPGATPGAFDRSAPAAGTGKAFVTLVDTTKMGLNSVPYSTFLGGTGDDNGFAIKVDSSGNAYVAGTTSSGAGGTTNFPTTAEAFQPALAAGASADGFISKVNPGGNGSKDLLYSTYFGGSGSAALPDRIFGVTVDPSNNIYVTGQTLSATTFPIAPKPGAFQTAMTGTSDAFVASLASDFTVTASTPLTVTNGSSINITATVTPVGGFSSAVALTCTEPAALTVSTCTPAPASVTPINGPVTSTVTVTTTALMPPQPSAPYPPLSMRQVVPLVLALLLLFLLLRGRQLRTRLGMATALFILIALAGCSGLPKPTTQKGTFNLTITGTSGNLVRSATVALTVN